MRLTLAAAVVSAGLAPAGGPAAWPQFRGPAGAGVAAGQKPPATFGLTENLAWQVEVPAGFSAPVVWGDKLFLTGFAGGKLYTLAYNRADGKELWRAAAPATGIEPYHKTEGSPAASTPATDGKTLVVVLRLVRPGRLRLRRQAGLGGTPCRSPRRPTTSAPACRR